MNPTTLNDGDGKSMYYEKDHEKVAVITSRIRNIDT